ncbi:hypothetical protein FHT44_005173 [Mycolicibacterium sp. BK634]|uniref:hypothetical protein n=1 Tax=Mycolicibacterium sp. BK634 TaxID=2587099 RepID=UPI0016075CCD|nr:hypothetical protein [Mycolicibacterium sp. BK634]MBB3752661.1 hypothetical protein [Mycolicibacterium sp. BK634]
MTSKVLDLATVAHALIELRDAFLSYGKWEGINEQQQEFLNWYDLNHAEIKQLDSLEALASTSHVELNRFLTDHGFDEMFDQFDGIGVASILDILMEWASEGRVTEIIRTEPLAGKNFYGQKIPKDVSYPAFQVDADIYEVGYEHPLVRLRTKTGHSLWLMKADEPPSGLALNISAQALLHADRSKEPSWTGVVVPMLEIDTDGDVEWLLGMNDGEYYLEQIFQKFKLRANEKGARVKVATGMVFARAACGPIEVPYTFDDPFVGFFTQPGHDTLLLAAFWADTDSWRKPSGSLEDL